MNKPLKNLKNYPVRQPNRNLALFQRKKISLWDMIQFAINDFSVEFLSLIAFREEIENRIKDVGELTELTKSEIARTTELFGSISNHLYVVEPSKTNDTIISLSHNEEQDIKFLRDLRIALRNIYNAIWDDFESLSLALVQPTLTKFFEEDSLFGNKVNREFPAAKEEIRAAGNCIAVDLNTAAVFHLMRVVEFGLRALASHLKIKKVKTHVPIEYAVWEELIFEMEKKRDALGKLTRGPKRQKALDFYNELLSEARSIKDLWRNPVSHARRTFSAKDAEAIFDHVKAFMQKLAEISETK